MWKLMQIEPQPAHGKFVDALMDDPNWIAEEKFDGDRRIAQFCDDGIVHFTGRKKSVKDGLFVEKTLNLPHLSGAGVYEQPVWNVPLETRHILEGTVLDGEMVVPENFVTGAGGKSKHVTSIMGSLPAEAIRKQLERGLLRFAVFDCLFFKGDDLRHLSYYDRRMRLEAAVHEWCNPYAFAAPLEQFKKKQFLADIEERGGEGIILKNINQKYGKEYGGHLKWVKVKFEWSADVIITGYKDAKEMSKKVTGELSATKYAQEGLIGAIVFGQYRDGKIWECGNTSGFDEALRRELSDRPEHFLGRVIEIKHFGREPSGKFRHPQFKGWRDDKAPEDCVFREDES